MLIKDIYSKYFIHQGLQQHMLWVATISNYIHPGSNDLLIAALLHDLANIIKTDIVNHPEILGPQEQSRLDYWAERIIFLKQTYGTDDHLATERMLKEIGVSDYIYSLISTKSLLGAIQVNASGSLEEKVLLYADMRVSPSGIVSLEDRLDDIFSRIEKYKTHPDKQGLVSAIRQVEKYLSQKTDLSQISSLKINYSFLELPVK